MSNTNNKDKPMIHYNTPLKSNYYAELNSYDMNKVFFFKTFASHKILKYKNKLAMRLYNAQNTTKSFWISIINPVLTFFHSLGMYICQGFIYIFILPFLRLKIRHNYNRSSDNKW